MKKISESMPVLVLKFCLAKLAVMIFHPLGNLPAVDFNNIYDPTIL